PVVGRTTVAARQLASRARRRVQGAHAGSGPDPLRQREIVAAFLAASRRGDFAALIALLYPDVVLRADRTAVERGAAAEPRGPGPGGAFARLARGLRFVLVDGVAGAAWMPGGQPRVVVAFTIEAGTIAAMELIADPVRLRDLDLVELDA